MDNQEFLKWLRGVEAKWQKLWRESRVFEANPDSRPKFYITVPYPYTNGPLHIGHGRTYTIGDIVARYKRMRGFNVLYPMAFHITGTPILAISEKIARRDPKEFERYCDYVSMYLRGVDRSEVERIVSSFKDPLNLALFFAERVHTDFEALGYSIDWRRRFHTGEGIYSAFITWQYLKLFEKGMITRGDHVVTYCLLHAQPEGEDDIEDADVNPVEILEYTAIKFKLKNGVEHLVASTLRPETLFGAVNIWVNPDATYVKVKWRGEELIVSKEALVKLKHQNPEDEFQVISELKGSELVGKVALSPLNRELIVLPASFVDPGNATGIVYSEPSDAPYDYVALMELKRDPSVLEKYSVDPKVLDSINPVKIIDVPGVSGHHAELIVKEMGIVDQLDPRLEEATRFVYKEQFYKGRIVVDDPEFRGLSVAEARERMVKKLLESGMGFVFYELNRKARCRSGGEIIVAKIKGQWFIDYSQNWLKELGKRYVESVLRIQPEKYRKIVLNTIDWLDKRPCARRRGIGTQLPFDRSWVIESLSDSTLYMAFYTIVHIIRQHGIKPEQLTPRLFDYVFLGIGSLEDVSKETGIDPNVIERMRTEFLYWYPVDQRHTGVAHLSNHLTFYILHHIAVMNPEHYPKSITLNEMVIREGAKMSKSKGNVILLREIVEKYSADLFRLYVASAASLDTILDWRERDVASTLDSLRTFVYIAENAINRKCSGSYGKLIDKWFLSKFNRLLKEATESMENMEIREYVQKIFYQFLNLYNKYRDMACEEDAICVVKLVLDKVVKALNPVIPHVTEEIWEWMGGGKFLSTMEWPMPEESLINDELEILVDNVEKVIEDLKNVLSVVKPVKNVVYIIVASPWKRDAIELFEKLNDVGKTINEIKAKYGLSGREGDIVAVINIYRRGRDERILKTTGELEYRVYSELKDYIAAKIGLRVNVMWEEEALSKGLTRAAKALPLKPAFYVE